MSRSSKKGPFVDENLTKKVKSGMGDKSNPIKTWARYSQIPPEFVNKYFQVHNGRIHVEVFVTEDMVGHRLGEFAPTRTFRGHGQIVKRIIERPKNYMEVRAIQKNVRLSPKKLRFVADVARKMKPTDAIEKLPFIGKKAAEPVILVIKSALANAKNKEIDITTLVFKELQINEGPRLKRGRPVSRGRWHPYKRRMSHIRVVLETKEIRKEINKEKVGEIKDKTEKKEETEMNKTNTKENLKKEDTKSKERKVIKK
jgi:small subunit ribosomal protein S19